MVLISRKIADSNYWIMLQRYPTLFVNAGVINFEEKSGMEILSFYFFPLAKSFRKISN